MGPDSADHLGHGEDWALTVNETAAARGHGAEKRQDLMKRITQGLWRQEWSWETTSLFADPQIREDGDRDRVVGEV